MNDKPGDMSFEFERKNLDQGLSRSTRLLVWVLRKLVIHRKRLWTDRERFAVAVATDILRHPTPLRCTLGEETIVL